MNETTLRLAERAVKLLNENKMTVSAAALMPSHTPDAALLIVSHNPIQKLRNPSEVFHRYMKPAASADSKPITIPIGFADIAIFNSFCARVMPFSHVLTVLTIAIPAMAAL